VELSKARMEFVVNIELCQNFIRDLVVLVPLHADVVRKAAGDPKNRGAWRRAAETARDVLSVVTELEVAIRPPPLEDEFSSLQAMLIGPIGDLDAFEVVNDSRDVAQAARQAVAEDPSSGNATDILSTIAELEMALPEMLVQPGCSSAAKVVTSLPSLEKAVKKRNKKRAEDRLEAPEDDLVRLGQYARAGVEEQELKRVQEGVSKKAEKWARKQKQKAKGMADPIRQQRIMEAVSELEAMAPLQMEAFAGVVEEPEVVFARDALEELSAGLANMSGEVSCLFPDLLLVTPIDLDSAIVALQQDAHETDAPPLVLRNVDLETLVPRTPSLATAPEMLQLDVLDTPLTARKKSAKNVFEFAAEPLAQRVVECLAGAEEDDDEQMLEGAELVSALDGMIALVSDAAKEAVTGLVAFEPRLLPQETLSFVNRVCSIIRNGKRVAASLAASDQGDEDTPVMYTGLEDLANRVAELMFSVEEFLVAAQDGHDEAVSFRASCSAVVKQLSQLEQLCTSHALLLSVEKLEIPSAESTLALAKARLEEARQVTEESLGPPKAETLDQIKELAKLAEREWQWDEFLTQTIDALKRTNTLVPKILDSGKRVLVRQAGDALEGRAKQLLWASVKEKKKKKIVCVKKRFSVW
jgi:hypothetical protein